MAQDLEVLKQKLIKLKAQLPTIYEECAKEFSLNVKALAVSNITNSGVKDESGSAEVYSENEVPAFWFRGKELNASGISFLDGLPKIKKTSKEGKEYESQFTNWGDFREAQGLQKRFVDLSYSNEMWRGMLPGDVEVIGNKYISPLGHTNRAGQDKMNWNYHRYGNFIMQSIDIEIVNRAIEYSFNKKIKEFLNE